MCGIAEKLRFDGRTGQTKDFNPKIEDMHHRGPDGTGQYLDGSIGLAFTRLAIIDVAGGQQPIFNEDESVAIICNGEIYNYPELREKLEACGHTFRTHSDDEVVLHLYEEKGEACFADL